MAGSGDRQLSGNQIITFLMAESKKMTHRRAITNIATSIRRWYIAAVNAYENENLWI